jgi:hypothetical protein
VAISITPDDEIPEVVRGQSFSATVSASADDTEVINQVTATLQGDVEPRIVITPGETSVNISGSYIDAFIDLFTYVERGSSNLIETPTRVRGTSNLPPEKDFFDLNQDVRREITRTYTITVTYDGGSTEDFTVTHDIVNTLEAIRSFVASYYD